MSEFTIKATTREDLGKGASRRLRRTGNIPAIVYGGAKNRKPVSLTIAFKDITKTAEDEAFFSSVLNLEIDGKAEQVVLMDMQRHPARADIMHLDFERVTKSTILHKTVPVHYINEDKCNAVKILGGKIQHNLNELEIECKASALPEFIEVDMAKIEIGQTVHLSDVKLPKGVELKALQHGDDKAVCSIIKKAGETDADAADSAEEAAAE